MDQQQNTEAPLEIVSSDAVNAIERGQIDMQVATAKKYPRSVKQFLTEAESMITMSTEVAEGCNYKLKRKEKDGGVKVIEGPSIRLMEIAAAAYGNLRYGSRIVAIDQDYVTAQGVAIDMQKNIAITVEVQRSIKGKFGRYSNDMIMVTCNAAGSIARRNALLGAIPRVYVNQLAGTAKKFAIGDAKSLPERLQRAFAYFTTVLGVDLARVLAYVEKPSIQDCTLEDLGELQDLKTMLKEGEITLETAFPDPNKVGQSPDLTGKGQTPDLGQKQDQGQGGTVPQNTGSVPQNTPSVPQNQGSVPQNVTTLPTQAATTQAPTEPAKPKRQRAPKPQEPAQTAPASPEASQATPQAPPAPVLTIEQKADALDGKLEAEGVEVGDFFDWCKSAGRAAKFKFNPDQCQSIADAPEALIDALLADNSPDLAACVRVHGRAARERNQAAGTK